MTRPVRSVSAALALACATIVLGCGGDDAGSGPSSSGPIAATITITSTGASPRTVTVAAGSRVTFLNNDSVPHEIASDPHPTHTDCRPELDAVGHLQPGQSRTTANLNTVRSCGFHDHINDQNASLQGTITIQ